MGGKRVLNQRRGYEKEGGSKVHLRTLFGRGEGSLFWKKKKKKMIGFEISQITKSFQENM